MDIQSCSTVYLETHWLLASIMHTVMHVIWLGVDIDFIGASSLPIVSEIIHLDIAVTQRTGHFKGQALSPPKASLFNDNINSQ